MIDHVKYFVNKFYKPLILLIIVLILNYAAGFLMDLLLSLFSDLLPELSALLATLAITLIISILVAIPIYRVAVKLKPRIFPNEPQAPRSQSVGSLPVTTSSNTQSSRICHCTKGYATDFSGMMKYDLKGETFTISAGVAKHANGYGLIRIDAGVTGHFKTCAFRINYCPRCGGRLSDLSSTDEKLLQKNNL